MDKRTKERIKELKKEKKYDDIFVEFGTKVFTRNVPYKYRKKDLNKLTKEGKYEDIFNKYGKKEYEKMLTKAMYNEIKETRGKIPAILWNIKQRTTEWLKYIGFNGTLMLSAGATVMSISTKQMNEENAEIYRDEIKQYNENIEDYAKDVNEMGLSDVQIFMKVMDDMWGSIKGYAKPEKDISGFLELDLATEEGYGQCRNMASDVARKLNEINPKYNARTMVATMGEDGFYELADIERNILQTNETVENMQQGETNQQFLENMAKVTGNHMVTLVDVPSDNLTIVLDPTNPGIGMYKNGQIIMINPGMKDKEVIYEPKELTEAIVVKGGFEGLADVTLDYIKSFREPKLTYEEIENKYGIEAQNKALKEVRAREKVEEIFAEQEKNELKRFKDDMKIELPKGDLEQFDFNGENYINAENDIEEEK